MLPRGWRTVEERGARSAPIDPAQSPATSKSKPGSPARLRVLALTIKPEGSSPGQRFRLEQWAPYLRARHGIELTFAPFESERLSGLLYRPGAITKKAYWVLRDFLRRARALHSARRFDAVVVYREAALIGPAIYERLLAWSGVPLLFDFDDAIWEDQLSPMNGLFSRLHFWGKTATTCRVATVVTVGNPYLAAYAGQHNSNVCTIPTTIDLSAYPLVPEPPAGEPFTVCWTGSITTLPLFEQAREALEQFAKRRPLRVKIICNAPPRAPIAGAENLFVPWQAKGEAEEIGNCHVGIMPLPDDRYMNGKCALKALQFMATGRPVVLSPVGMNRDLIRDGENGFLANGTDEWVHHLLRLADSAELRRRVGLAGRKTVERDYSALSAATKFADAIRGAIKLKSGQETALANFEACPAA